MQERIGMKERKRTETETGSDLAQFYSTCINGMFKSGHVLYRILYFRLRSSNHGKRKNRHLSILYNIGFIQISYKN